MAKKSKLKKILITIAVTFVSIVLAISLAGLAVYNFVIIPKYNRYITSGEKQGEKLTNKDIVTFAKYLTDRDFIESLTNIDKDTAKDVLSALLEIEDETAQTDGEAEDGSGESANPDASGKDEPAAKTTPFISLAPEKNDIAFTQANTSKLYSPSKAPAGTQVQNHQNEQGSTAAQQNTPAPATPAPAQQPQIQKSDVPKKHQTAYDRIMAAASKEEIQAGMAIIAKVNMSKVNSLQAAGKTSELKAYIKSVLSSGEISTALKLYRKYKHLL